MFSQNKVEVEKVTEIDEVKVVAAERRRGVLERIDYIPAASLSGASSSFENVLKVLPGVQSSNELSSQYSVRGGSYDENLVYVNGVEIYRPMLTRTGQQEGLSFINPQLVSTVEFSTGGFGAEFGDKMSSVLNVGYKRPTSFGGSVEASLLGASAASNFTGFGGKLGGAVGLRYKRATYLLGTLDTKGEYNPSFADIQAVLTYDFSEKLSLNFLGSVGQNRYNFEPANRETSFGTLDMPQKFTMFYEGAEADRTENYLGALTLNFRPHSRLSMSFTASATSMTEVERYDILGEYWLNETVNDPSVSSDVSDVGVGASLDHARSYLATQVYVGEYRGSWYHGGGTLKWGLRARHHRVSDVVSQWQRIDSAGYMQTADARYLDTAVAAQEFSGFLQEAYTFELSNGSSLRLLPGLRFTYSNLSKEFLISPRVQAIFFPHEKRDMQFYASVGSYAQPAFYKEMKSLNAPNSSILLNTEVAAQRSLHFTLGASIMFKYLDIPCKFTTEIYAKMLSNLLPYKQDNVALYYDFTHKAKGYVVGLDAKLSGELIKGSESWISLSLMKAAQDVQGDFYVNKNGETVYPGYFPMANDQRLNVSVMLQDKLFAYNAWRVYLVLNYGTSLPTLVPVKNRYDLVYRMPSYLRPDLGLTYVLFDDNVNKSRAKLLGNTLRSCALTLEVLNLFDVQNTSSYLWVRTIAYEGQGTSMVAVPNYLTPLRLNAKLAVTF
ncbi:MAG: TonB-dependent receptor plug domain-containing protein [Prevotellaceae bacterium]|nr:TonB-dependent receptor plug domain-containing protein [Prevotellaceae bacterium]